MTSPHRAPRLADQPHGHQQGHGHPSGDIPTDPLVTAATPKHLIVLPLILGWLGSLCAAILLFMIGQGVDLLRTGEPVPGGGVAILVLLCGAIAMLSGVSQMLVARAKTVTERTLRLLLIGHLLNQAPFTGQGRRTGSIVSAATSQTEKVANYRGGFIGPITASFTTPILILGFISLTIDLAVAGWLALLLPLIPLLIWVFQKLFRTVSGAYRRSSAALSAAFLDTIQGAGTLALYGAGPRAAANLAKTGQENRRQVMKLLAGNQLLIFVVDASFSLTMLAGSAVLAMTQVAAQLITVGQGVSLVLLTVLLTGPVDLIGQFFYIGMTGRAAERGISAELATSKPGNTGNSAVQRPVSSGQAPSHQNPADPTDAKRQPALQFNHVSAAYEQGRPVLHDFSLTIVTGEHVTLVGPSGVGKSTVSALVQGFLTPSEGHVLVNGVSPSDHPDQTRSQTAVVEQSSYLFTGSIADNLRIANPHAKIPELITALEQANLWQDVATMPAGLDTQVGEQGLSLSGGQAGRLAIARAILKDAPILILDEPTSQVDLRSEEMIIAAITELAKGKTVLTIAHRPGAILPGSRVIELSPKREQEQNA